jgi:UDP-N-acetylmuramoyl-L-alanyl-D-glutamate--2,6-diaminopimelate ligase
MKNFLKKILPNSFIIFYHKLQAMWAAIRFGFPAKKMIIIGVTGTNGKTTTVNLIGSILQTAGYKTAQISTINYRIGDKIWTNLTKMTTIRSHDLQEFLSAAYKSGCQYAVVETTSHAAVQNRIWGIPYDIMVFTNLTHDHLDYHKTMAEYRNAKGLLFQNLKKSFHKPGVKKVSVVNADDPNFDYFYKFPADLKYSYRIGGKSTKQNEITANKIYSDISGSKFEFQTDYGDMEIKTKLPGNFNISNALAAICVGLSQNIQLDIIKKGIEKVVQVSGRMERINAGQDFQVIVDFAHTPDALQKIYQTIKPLVRGKIIAVLGATGERDTTKRPIMGALAGSWADKVFITNEDPYHENPQDIIDSVAVGVPRGRKNHKLILGIDYFKILDRREAIEKALQIAQKDDLVVITGKGGEKFMCVGDKKIPWDEKEIVTELLQKRLKG